jgi:acetyl esterase/lipase
VELTRRSVLLPDIRARRRYVAARGRDLSYGDAGRRNHLDVWCRADLPAGARAPVLLQVHGGAWVMGQKLGQAIRSWRTSPSGAGSASRSTTG